HLRSDIARTNRNDSYSAATHFETKAFQIDHRCSLGCAIGARSWEASKSSHAGDAHQRSSVCGVHTRQEGLKCVEQPDYVDIQNFLEHLAILNPLCEGASAHPSIADD